MRNATLTAYSTLVQTFTNGARTGLTPITIAFRLIAIRRARQKENANPRAAAPGVIRQKCPAAPPAPASPRNFNTRTMASASRGTSDHRLAKTDEPNHNGNPIQPFAKAGEAWGSGR